MKINYFLKRNTTAAFDLVKTMDNIYCQKASYNAEGKLSPPMYAYILMDSKLE